jgi:hypothetical protein
MSGIVMELCVPLERIVNTVIHLIFVHVNINDRKA